MLFTKWLRFDQLGRAKRATRIVCAAAAALAAIALTAHSASAAYVNVYGGPTYTPGQAGVVVGVNDAGTAVGNADGAYRWDASGTPAIWFGSLASDINNAGMAAGNFLINETFSAFRWDGSGWIFLESLGAIGGLYADQTAALAINDAGTAVGWSFKYNDSGVYQGIRPVRWDALGNAATELASLGSDVSAAVAINDAGTAVGNAQVIQFDAVYSFAVRWDSSDTGGTVLGNVIMGHVPFTYGNAVAINNAGTAVGNVSDIANSRAVRWDAYGTAATELENLGTDVNNVTESGAVAVNDAGTIVGYADKYDDTGMLLGRRAVRWDASGTAATELGDLGTNDEITESDVFAINDAGIAVGYADDYDGSGANLGERAVYWGPDGLAVDLNTLIEPVSGWTLNRATAISNTGWIGGSGLFDPDGPGGQQPYGRLFLIQVPAPSDLPGDYNRDGTVDAADYVVWRKTDGTQAGYNQWRAHFGQTAGTGATFTDGTSGIFVSNRVAIPEPSAIMLLAVGVVLLSRRVPRWTKRFSWMLYPLCQAATYNSSRRP